MRRALVVLISALFVGLVSAPGSALVPATTVDDVVSSLRSDPVYNDPEAENALTDAQAADLRDQIASSGSSVFIAVLPAAARGSSSTENLVRYLQDNVGEPGTYAAVVGSQFRSTSQSAATGAFESQQGNGVFAVLSQFVTNVETIDSGGTVEQCASVGVGQRARATARPRHAGRRRRWSGPRGQAAAEEGGRGSVGCCEVHRGRGRHRLR